MVEAMLFSRPLSAVGKDAMPRALTLGLRMRRPEGTRQLSGRGASRGLEEAPGDLRGVEDVQVDVHVDDVHST